MDQTRLECAADKLEIAELLARWHHNADLANWDALRSDVFTEDIEWTWAARDGAATITDQVNGNDAVLQWVQTAMAGSNVWHITASHVYQISGDTAATRSYMLVTDRNSLDTLAAGVVDAKHVRTASGWRIRGIHIAETLRKGAVAFMAELLADRPNVAVEESRR